MAHSRAVSVYYPPDPVGWLILKQFVSTTCWSQCPITAGASRMAHSRAVSVLYLLDPVGWLILELLVSSTCWSQ